MLPISKRSRELGTENAFVVLGEVAKLQAEGSDIVSFCIGQPDFPTPDHIRLAGIRAITEGKTGYTPSPGIPELRSAVAAYFTRTRGVTVTSDDVVCGCGGKPFIGYSILSVVDPGEGHEVIFPTPGFPIYEAQVKAHGGVCVPLPLRESRAFNFDIDELKKKINAKTRLLILCSPGNPTGNLLKREDLAEIAALCAPFENLWIYSDEVYSGLVYDGGFQSIAAFPGMMERTIIADSASKTYAMTGWRIGYAANAKLAPVFTRWVTNTDSCASQISQWAAVEAVTGPQDAADAMRAKFLQRRDLIVDLLNGVPGVTCRTPGGAFYAWPNVTEACRMTGCADSEEFRKRLLLDAGIAVLADIHFGRRVPGDGQHIRFSYAASNEAIGEGIDRLSKFVRDNTR